MTTGVLATPPILQFLLNNGTLAVGGSVLTQVGGVNAGTFQDLGLTTPLPNPIPLNSRGEVSDSSGISRQLFLTPNTVYTFTLFDGPNGTGNQVWSAPYLNGIQVTQSSLGQLLYPQTAAEAAASVTPVNYAYPPYYAQRYGFLPSASATTNTAALQNCFNAMAEASILGPISVYPGVTESGPTLVIPDGTYHINAAITIPGAGTILPATFANPGYALVRANKVILIQDTAGTDHFTCTQSYRLDIEGITFVSGRHALNATGANLDTSRVRMARCDFQTGSATDYAIFLNQQTCNTLIEDCLVTDSPLFANVNGDFCSILNCWVNGYLSSSGLKPNSTDSVANNARVMRVEGGAWVPESSGAGSTSSRWFSNNGGLLSIQDVQFGSEGSGGLPIVYEFGNTAQGGTPFISVSGTIIRGGQLASGNSSRTDRGVIVLQGSVPSIMSVRDSQYVAFGKIISSAGFSSPTLATWLTNNIYGTNYKFAISIENVGQEPTSSQLAESVPIELLPFATLIYGPRGSSPGFRILGPINQTVTPYLPDWSGILGQVQEFVCGQQRAPVASTYFNAINVFKTANTGATSAATAIVDIDVCSAHSNGGVMYVQQATYRVTLLVGGTGVNISNAVDLITHNDLGQGGAALGNKLLCQVNPATLSPTSAQIQLQLNTPIGTSGAITWRARLVSSATGGGGVAQMFSISSF